MDEANLALSCSGAAGVDCTSGQKRSGVQGAIQFLQIELGEFRKYGEVIASVQKYRVNDPQSGDCRNRQFLYCQRAAIVANR